MSGRRPVAAGTFYPDDPAELADVVDRLLREAKAPAVFAEPVGLIAPHAGYDYSGPVAASAYAVLASPGPGPTRFAILGPSHFAPLFGVAVSSADAWSTPLGDVPVDAELRHAAVAAGAVVDDGPHRRDHAIEVHLPFLQRIALEPTVLPLAVGSSKAEATADLVEVLVAEPGTLVVLSTDLSHYHPHPVATRLDARTAGALVSLEVDAIGDDAACGVFALRGLLAAAARRGWSIVQLDLRTSAHTAGGATRVVGYGAFAALGSG